MTDRTYRRMEADAPSQRRGGPHPVGSAAISVLWEIRGIGLID